MKKLLRKTHCSCTLSLTKTLCKKAVEDEPETLEYVPDHFKTQEMCIKALEENPWTPWYVLEHLTLIRLVFFLR